MNKDLLTTIIGALGAATMGAKEYVSVQATGEWSMTNWIGLAGAVLIAVFGYWSGKDKK